jgi:lysine-N-methylase
METREKKQLRPEYIERFSCIGTDCEDTCCAGWRVDIDKNTYKKYRNVKDKEMKITLNEKIKRNRSNPSERQYAKIKLESDNSCPMLTEDKLCSIHFNLGEEYLSSTCAIYPRYFNRVNNVFEQSATMSCPEAARLALLNKDGIAFNEVQDEIDHRVIPIRSLVSDHKDNMNNPHKYFWELRVFTISLLQNRDYTLSERLVILGLFFQKLDEVIKGRNIEEVPSLIARYQRLTETKVFKEEFGEIPTNYEIQMELLKELTDERIFFGSALNPRYYECFKQFLNGINYTTENTIEEITKRYKDAFKEYYNPFMKDREYILENYLVNYVFKNLFPFSKYDSVFEEYVMLVVHYAMIKLHLIGISNYHEELNEDLVIKLIQSFVKTVEHNENYLKRIYELLKAFGFTKMSYMAILIKN